MNRIKEALYRFAIWLTPKRAVGIFLLMCVFSLFFGLFVGAYGLKGALIIFGITIGICGAFILGMHLLFD